MELFRGSTSSGAVGSALLGGIGASGSSGILMACPSNDTSFFCQFSRIFKIIMMVVSLLAIVYIAYAFFIAKKAPFSLGGARKIFTSLK
jgi:hypothetical protein